MTHKVRPRTVIRYCDEHGVEPYTKWFDGLRDVLTQVRIAKRIDRIENGNFGDAKSLRDGVFELRLHFGPGYRVYLAEDGDDVVLLLIGGDKSTQKSDIKTAKEYWKEYQDNG